MLGYGDPMVMIRQVPTSGAARLPVCAAVLALTAALALTACGGDDSPESAQEPSQANADAPAPTETAAQPPPESAEGEASEGGTSRETEEALAEQAATGPQSCPDVVITPNSGNGLFAVEAEGITCEDASAALLAWGESGYPGEDPPGFACEEVSEGRLSCEQEASGGVVEFDTGA
jgi:hypothetical protein